jgi:hypothetical protein
MLLLDAPLRLIYPLLTVLLNGNVNDNADKKIASVSSGG